MSNHKKVLQEIDMNSFEADIDENPNTPAQLFASVSTPPRISRIRTDAPPPTLKRGLGELEEREFIYL